MSMWKTFKYIKLNGVNVELNDYIGEQIRYILPETDETAAIIRFLYQWTSDDEWVELSTSGSTGVPKTIITIKDFLIRSAQRTCTYFGLNQESIGLLCLPASYIAGQMMLVRAIISGMNLIVIPAKGNLVKELSHPIDFAAMVPNQVLNSLDTPEKFNLIKTLIIGGGQVNHLLVDKLKAITTRCYETFGMTETLSHIALKQVWPQNGEYFTTLPGIKVTISPNGNLIIDDPDLEISGMKTNDLIEMQSETHFRWIGRSDFVINSGGLKISPEELERQIAPLIENPFCISSIPDEKLENKLVLVIEKPEFDTCTLCRELKERLHPYSNPKKIIFIEKMPSNRNGKLDRLAIRNGLKLGTL